MVAALVCATIGGLREPPASFGYFFARGQRVASGGKAPESLAIGDLDGDGRPEIVVANYKSNTLAVLAKASAGSYGVDYTLPTGLSPAGVVLADVDEDGRLDALASSVDSSRVDVLLNRSGRVQSSRQVPTGGAAYSLGVGDFTGDAHLDAVVTVDAPDDGRLTLLTGDGHGGFTATRLASTPGVATDLDIGDLNEDGRPDVFATISPSGATAIREIGLLAVLLSDAQGFAPLRLTRADDIDAATLSDVNRDGHLDSVLTSRGGGVVTLLGDGRGGWLRAKTVQPGWEGTGQPVLSDLDGDGALDLITGVSTTRELLVNLGVGTGQFRGRPSRYPVASFPDALSLGDLNGDGHDDVVVGSDRSRIRILLANTACRVPSLVGRDRSEATRRLSEGGCRLGRVARANPRAGAPDTVVAQGTPAGKRLPLGAQVPIAVTPPRRSAG